MTNNGKPGQRGLAIATGIIGALAVAFAIFMLFFAEDLYESVSDKPGRYKAPIEKVIEKDKAGIQLPTLGG